MYMMIESFILLKSYYVFYDDEGKSNHSEKKVKSVRSGTSFRIVWTLS